jgi:hypothetical protein
MQGVQRPQHGQRRLARTGVADAGEVGVQIEGGVGHAAANTAGAARSILSRSSGWSAASGAAAADASFG